MAELDELLRDSFARLADASAGDSAGVAEAIRARVASGDPGAPAAGPTAPGWGGPGLGGVLGAIGVVVAAGVVGAALGVSGMFGHPVTTVRVSDAVVATAVDVHLCAGGPVTGRIAADTRVLAVARDDDGLWIGVRDPATLLGTVWVRAAVVTPDAPATLAELPVAGACPVVAVEPIDPGPVPAPDPGEEPAPNPAPNPGPAPQPGDTTAPVMGQASANPTTVYNGDPSTITAAASDDVGVVSVSISWAGATSGSASMSPVGGQWRYTWPNGTASYGIVTFSIRAVDAAGNTSSPATVVVDHQYFG